MSAFATLLTGSPRFLISPKDIFFFGGEREKERERGRNIDVRKKH